MKLASLRRAYQFKAEGGNVVTFIHDHVAVLRDDIVYDVFTVQTLSNCHINTTGLLSAPGAYLADRFCW